jgi:hypothetical protein
MANFFDSMGDWFAQKVAKYIQDPQGKTEQVLDAYYEGNHRAQLKRVEGQGDDNLSENFVGLAVDRSVSRLYAGGAQFVLPEGREAQQEYLDKVWDVNKKEIILYQNGLYGAVHGTWYFKIIPDDILDPYTEKLYPRLLPIHPRYIRIKTDPQDMNDVERYTIEYTVTENRNGRMVKVTHTEITKHKEPATDSEYTAEETWVVESYEKIGGAPVQLIASMDWDYTFPPIIHCKNLPSLNSCYGDSEIDDTIGIQDKYNFTASNIGKIIKYHGSPNTILTGVSAKEVEPVDGAPNAMFAISNKDAKAYNLEMQSDLLSSQNFLEDRRRSIFSIAREIDTQTMADKLGALTNFGLKVLYTDAINKTDTKRQLYGDAFKELNRRLLVLQNWTGEESNPGEIVWGETMPLNMAEEVQIDQILLGLGIVDKETVYKHYQKRYGVTWEEVQANLANQDAAANANNANIGATILRNFSQGQ